MLDYIALSNCLHMFCTSCHSWWYCVLVQTAVHHSFFWSDHGGIESWISFWNNNLQSYLSIIFVKSINIDQLLLFPKLNRIHHNINRSSALIRFAELTDKQKCNVDTSAFDGLALTCVIELIKIWQLFSAPSLHFLLDGDLILGPALHLLLQGRLAEPSHSGHQRRIAILCLFNPKYRNKIPEGQ